LAILIKVLPNIKSFKLIFKLLDKIISLKHSYLLLLLQLQDKLIEILKIYFIYNENENKYSKEISKEDKDIISHLIYLSDKINIAEELLIKLTKIIDNNNLKEILKNIFNNYKIENFIYCNELIKILINKKQLDFISFLINNKQIDKIDNILVNHIIQFDDIIPEEDSCNYLLLKTLKQKNYFNLYFSTSFSQITFIILEDITKKLLFLNNIYIVITFFLKKKN